MADSEEKDSKEQPEIIPIKYRDQQKAHVSSIKQRSDWYESSTENPERFWADVS